MRRPKMSPSEKEQTPDGTRDKIQNWLMADGWKIAEQSHRDLAWLTRAEDAGGRIILVGQYRLRQDQIYLEAVVNITEEHRRKFESLPGNRRKEILWNLRFRLLLMNVEFSGVAEPMQNVMLTQRVYLDGLTRDGFIQRFLMVRNAVITVIWSIMQDLEGVEPPAESVQRKAN
jgi:hypothetical protein